MILIPYNKETPYALFVDVADTSNEFIQGNAAIVAIFDGGSGRAVPSSFRIKIDKNGWSAIEKWFDLTTLKNYKVLEETLNTISKFMQG